MTRIGYTLSAEEFSAPQLVEHARAAEAAGFEFAVISDHFHPWTSVQGNSPFAWTTLGAIAGATERIELGTGVTCPTMRMHPALVAQAAATVATLAPGRFFLGVGSGERLNEHIIGHHWPDNGTRLAMLEEAVEIIRALFSGDEVTLHGHHLTIERAQLMSLPDAELLPPIRIAAGGSDAASLAGRLGDGLIAVAPSRQTVEAYRAAGGDGPVVGQLQVCWAETTAEARSTAHMCWPNAAWGGNVSQELATPADFEAVTELVSSQQVADKVVCFSDDPAPLLDAVSEYADAGFDHVYLHQVGPAQLPAIEQLARHLLGTPAAA